MLTRPSSDLTWRVYNAAISFFMFLCPLILCLIIEMKLKISKLPRQNYKTKLQMRYLFTSSMINLVYVFELFSSKSIAVLLTVVGESK